MFTIAFRDGRDGVLEYGARPLYNDEYLKDDYKSINIRARIGESFAEFISLTGDIAGSVHPYLQVAGDLAEGISENSFFLVRLREYVELSLDNPEFFSLDCFMFFLDMAGMSIPASYHQLQRKPGHEEDCVEDAIPADEKMSPYERSLRGFLAAGKEVYDVPLTAYECETIEDACIVSLHFMITHGFNMRKCENCGKYFIAYNRSDTIYCDRQSPFNTNKTCKEDGAIRTYNASVATNDLKRAIANTQSMWRMRKSRYPNDDELLQAADNFKKNLKKWRADYTAGTVTKEEFIAWLEHFNSKLSK